MPVVAIGAGLLLGLGVGYFVVGLVRYMSEPPLSMLFVVLVYGLGLVPFFMSLLGELAFSGRMMNAILLSAAFASTYYFAAFVTMFAMI